MDDAVSQWTQNPDKFYLKINEAGDGFELKEKYRFGDSLFKGMRVSKDIKANKNLYKLEEVARVAKENFSYDPAFIAAINEKIRKHNRVATAKRRIDEVPDGKIEKDLQKPDEEIEKKLQQRNKKIKDFFEKNVDKNKQKIDLPHFEEPANDEIRNKFPGYELSENEVLGLTKVFKDGKAVGFIESVIKSSAYTPEEKKLLFKAVVDVYCKTVGSEVLLRSTETLAEQRATLDYLSHLATEHNFITLHGEGPQWTNEDLASYAKDNFDAITRLLPKTCDAASPLYGTAVQVNGNHRTGFIIDLKNRRVEYFNSFGSDAAVGKSLTALAKTLSDKYGKPPFTYKHPTAGVELQDDGFQCGIWTCKMIEERIKQRDGFRVESMKGFDIADFRKNVYAKFLEVRFYSDVGNRRVNKRLTLDQGFREKYVQYKQKYFYKNMIPLIVKHIKNGEELSFS
jgi:hypothetical protein